MDKNHLFFSVENNTISPIERRILDDVILEIEPKLGFKINATEKCIKNVLFDGYILSDDSHKKKVMLYLNAAPSSPRFWQNLSLTHYEFAPRVIISSDEGGYVSYMVTEYIDGVNFHDIGYRPFVVNPNLITPFATSLKKMHDITCDEEDGTANVFDAMLFYELKNLESSFPFAAVAEILKQDFRKLYTPSEFKPCLCHFNLKPKTVVNSPGGVKFVNFERTSAGNPYIDAMVALDNLRASHDDFLVFNRIYGGDQNEFSRLKDAANLFLLAFWVCEVASEYLVFGYRDPQKLKAGIFETEKYYRRLYGKISMPKIIDKEINLFYDLWK